MRHPATLILLVLMASAAVDAQQPYSETFRFSEQRVNLEEKVPKEAQLYFSAFSNAQVYFRDRQSTGGLVNFNMLLDEIVHLDRRGQEMVTVGQIDSVIFETGDVFIFLPDHGFMERVAEGRKAGLYVRHQLRVITETYVQGPYGQATRTSSVTRVRSLDTGEGPEKDYYLENPGVAPMEVNVRYQGQFLLRVSSGFQRVGNRRQLQNAFPEYRQEIRDYLRDHSLSFTDGEQMKALVDFINQL
jgi:hypothetical protein